MGEDDLKSGASKRDEVYRGAMERGSREEFLGDIRNLAPRDFVVFGGNIRATADVLFPDAPREEYRPQFLVRPWVNVTTVMENFVRKYITNWHGKGRPKSLVLIGGSRLGKTEWARSHGRHLFFGSMFNMDKLDPEAKYAVLDDIDINYFPNYKSWCGGQYEFEVTDKYKAKRTFKWGKPVIWTVNPNNDPRLGKYADREWLQDNCYFVELTRALVEHDEEDELSDWEMEARAQL